MNITLAGCIHGQGGIQTHLYWLAKALAESGSKVTILSLGDAHDDELQDRFIELGVSLPVKIVSPKVLSKGTFGRVLSFWKIVQSLRSNPSDIYIACGTGWNLFVPAIISRTCNRRLFHEVMSGEVASRSDSRSCIRWGFHEVLAQASQVAENFRDSCPWNKTIKVLPAFPDPLESVARKVEDNNKLVPIGTAKAAFFSRLVPHKQALWLVRQWYELSTSLKELHIFGTGPEKEPIEKLIIQNGWQNSVFCHGRYPDGKEYAELLSSFDLTLLPTIGAEGAPLVLLESMACGVPFVAFDVGGIPDYENPNCMIVSAEHPETFVPQVGIFCQRLDAGQISQKAIQDFYRTHFSYNSLAQKWRSHLGLPCQPKAIHDEMSRSLIS